MIKFKCHYCSQWVVLEEGDPGAPVICAACGVKNLIPEDAQPATESEFPGYWTTEDEDESLPPLLITTTPTLEGHPVLSYCGMVTGLAVMGAGLFRDIAAHFTDVFGGRSGSYQKELASARQIAIEEMVDEAREHGANAIIAASLDYESISLPGGGALLMVSARGTAVRVEPAPTDTDTEEQSGQGD